MTPIQKLRNMVGKSWMYNTRLYFFDDVREFGTGEVVLSTDRTDFKFNKEVEIVRFLQEALPVDDKPVRQNAVMKPAISNDVANYLQEVLMDNIERLQKEKEYIPQAMAISKQVNTLINLTNLEMKIKSRQ